MPPKRKAPEKKPKAPADEEEHVEAVEDIPKEKNAAPAKKAKAASSTASASSNKLAVGDNVSSVTVTLTTEDNKEVTLSDITKDTGVIIFMYPRANTPGCTKQACGFKDNYDALVECGFDVYGMSFDKPKSQGNWKAKYSLPYHLLTDEDGVALKAFGAFKQPKNVIRSHIVIGKGGEVIDIQNQISPGDSFTSALATAQANKSA